MGRNQIINPEKLNAAIKGSKGINESSKSNRNNYAIDDENIIRLDPLMLRLHEMEMFKANLEKQLDQRTKELAEVVAANTKSISVIAHDLRSPFCNVLTALELIKESLVNHNTDDSEHFIKIASGSANSAINLISTLAEWVLLQNKGEKFSPVKINLKQFVGGEIENSSPYAKQNQISLNYSIPADLDVYIDIQMVRAILRNLISNAIKFTDSGGKITVSARESNSHVEIAVTDNGIGISPEDQKKISNNENIFLEPLSRKRQGSGLGLKLCREFAEIHGGHISLESKLGEGSKFTFSLPV